MKWKSGTHSGCPSEASLEAWAIRNAREQRVARGRRHLDRCPFCRRSHDRLVHFYRLVRGGGLTIPSRAASPAPRPILGRPGLPRPVIHTLRPCDAPGFVRKSQRPLAVSGRILSPHDARPWTERDFLSSDGSIRARRIEPDPASPTWLRLTSDPPAMGRRALVLLPGAPTPYQSDDLGLVRALPGPPPASIERIEIVSATGRADYGGAAADARRTIPSQVLLDAGPAGTVLVEQEEGDHGEPVLVICVPGVPPPLRARRLFVGLALAGGPGIVEAAIGGETYFYGPDLFEPLTVWVYIR